MSANQSREAIKLKLNELYEDAKQKGTITREEVANQIMELEIDAEQMNKVFETLERMGIDVMTTETTCLSSIWETDEVTEGFYQAHQRGED